MEEVSESTKKSDQSSKICYVRDLISSGRAKHSRTREVMSRQEVKESSRIASLNEKEEIR